MNLLETLFDLVDNHPDSIDEVGSIRVYDDGEVRVVADKFGARKLKVTNKEGKVLLLGNKARVVDYEPGDWEEHVGNVQADRENKIIKNQETILSDLERKVRASVTPEEEAPVDLETELNPEPKPGIEPPSDNWAAHRTNIWKKAEDEAEEKEEQEEVEHDRRRSK